MVKKEVLHVLSVALWYQDPRTGCPTTHAFVRNVRSEERVAVPSSIECIKNRTSHTCDSLQLILDNKGVIVVV